MSPIIPAVLPQSERDLEEKLVRFSRLPEIEFVQIDAVDGKFAAPACWPYTGAGPREFAGRLAQGRALPCYEYLRFDIDLMAEDPGRVAGQWVALGATRLTFHLESMVDLLPVIERVRKAHGHAPGFAPDLLSIGIAVNVATDLARLAPYAPLVDYVQLMGIRRIGRQGEPFAAEVLERIKKVRRLYPGLAIQIDGGATRETAARLFAAGADRLVVGHDLLGAGDLRAEYAHLTGLAELYGRYTRR